MKRLLVFIMILVTGSSFMQDDNYYIMFIKGNAVNTVTGRGSRIGDMLRPSDKILLKDANSKVVLLHSKKGRI